uniref:Integrin, beta 5 n=1 Tax=Cyprinodon variegatus TaxID=28743 RepID=A0A3Q2CFB4_CYPVA
TSRQFFSLWIRFRTTSCFGSATSCEECLLINPSCAWCAQEDFGKRRSLTSRCDFKQNLQKRGCEPRFIESPRSAASVLESRPLSSKGSGAAHDVVSITPQKISLSLRRKTCIRGLLLLNPLCYKKRPAI